MPERRAEARTSTPTRTGPAISAGLFAVFAIAILTAAGIGARYGIRGDFDISHALLILFFSINLVICHWEWSLVFRRDYIEERAEYWRKRQHETGRTPAVEFLTTRVPLTRIFSLTAWADVWATYSRFDGSYEDRRTYGYNVDVANGFVTPVPTLVLYAAYTFDWLPAVTAGIIGALMFWQLIYATAAYWCSFFLAKRQERISRRDLYIYIWALNAPWFLFALLGLYVSIDLIVNGDYGVLGY